MAQPNMRLTHLFDRRWERAIALLHITSPTRWQPAPVHDKFTLNNPARGAADCQIRSNPNGPRPRNSSLDGKPRARMSEPTSRCSSRSFAP
jgi:hypothetical protein